MQMCMENMGVNIMKMMMFSSFELLFILVLEFFIWKLINMNDILFLGTILIQNNLEYSASYIKSHKILKYFKIINQ